MTHSAVVEHRRTGEVWLEGTLERGIVPEGCVWTAGQGDNEDGFLLLLQKMNLELLRQCASKTALIEKLKVLGFDAATPAAYTEALYYNSTYVLYNDCKVFTAPPQGVSPKRVVLVQHSTIPIGRTHQISALISI